MTRRRKFELGDICYWNKPVAGISGVTAMPYYGVIVDYKQNGAHRGWYRVVRTLHPANGAAFGESVWVETHFLSKVLGLPQRHNTVRIYRANNKLLQRGCECNCCAHEAIDRSAILKDGTFRWDYDNQSS